MEAKDTVIKIPLDFYGATAPLLERQAELSFKAGEDKGYAHARQHCEDVIIPQAKAEGIREVVEWQEKNLELFWRSVSTTGHDYYIPLSLADTWQAFKKERGV